MPPENPESRKSYAAINLAEKFDKFSEQWTPKIIARMNDYHFKLGKIQGEFIWHSHADSDEVFLVIDGNMRIEFRDGAVELNAGEMFIVPKGVEHKPSAARECRILMVELAGTVNTGGEINELTFDANAWI